MPSVLTIMANAWKKIAASKGQSQNEESSTVTAEEIKGLRDAQPIAKGNLSDNSPNAVFKQDDYRVVRNPRLPSRARATAASADSASLSDAYPEYDKEMEKDIVLLYGGTSPQSMATGSHRFSSNNQEQDNLREPQRPETNVPLYQRRSIGRVLEINTGEGVSSSDAIRQAITIVMLSDPVMSTMLIQGLSSPSDKQQQSSRTSDQNQTQRLTSTIGNSANEVNKQAKGKSRSLGR